jgi:hypothetical protein
MKVLKLRLMFAATTACAAALALAPEHRADARDAPDAGLPPRFDEQPFPEEKTPAPTRDEWKAAPRVGLTDQNTPLCHAYRVREWMKIDCTFLTSGIAELGGSRDGVLLYLKLHDKDATIPEGGEIIFPVRRGDRRVFEWSTFGDTYEGVGSPEVALVFSESWTADELGPTIIVR